MARRAIDPARLAPSVRPGRYHPTFNWGQPYEGWAKGFVRKNTWRIRYVWGDEDDAIQECAIVFLRCKAKYEGRIIEPKHFMALFKMSVSRQFHSASQKDSDRRPIELPDMDYGRAPVESYWRAALAFLSEESRTVVNAAFSAPAEFVDLLFDGAGQIGDDTEAGAAFNSQCKRLLRMPKGGDILAEIRGLLGSV